MTASSSKKEGRYGRLDLLCDLVSLTCVMVMFLLVAMNWGGLADAVPTHYGMDGQPDGWGGRGAIFLLPGLGLLLFLLLTAARLLPREAYNFPVTVTQENRERLHALAREMLGLLKSCIIAGFLPMLVFQVKGLPLPGWYFWAMLALVFCPLAVYMVRMVKNK